MRLPVTQVYKLIDELHLPWLDALYPNSIPEEERDNTDSTVILLTETENEPTYNANATFKGMSLGVEVQIFYKLVLPDDFDLMTAEIELQKAFRQAGWLIEQSKNHVTDPDTQQQTKTMYLTKNETI